MAKRVIMPGSSEQKYPYPSHYGSHKSMVASEGEDGTVICKDEHGEYQTTKDRLDSGLADPRRYALSRLKEEKKAEAK